MSEIETDNIEVWPTHLRHYQAGSFQLVARNLFSMGSLSGELRPHGPLVQRFTAKFTFPPKHDVDTSSRDIGGWRELSGLVARLRGVEGRVRVSDFGRRRPAYDLRRQAAGTITDEAFSDGTEFSDGTGFEAGALPSRCAIDAYAQRGARTVVFRSLPASLTAAFEPGDLFEVRPNGAPAEHGHLYEIVRKANTDASGKTRVYFEPSLRAGVAAGDAVILQEPMTLMRLAADNEGEIQRDQLHGRLGLTFVEILPRTLV